ncbi:DUF4956 domain-containing protein [Virgisporangium aliadipatigenens]|uniref:DUF4956 domain-containing protein n=1 Tax=Virgisporangium aliadipatigenens TaxID=741659 RepID=A0A8J3YKJ0_9ACTN|nr:DUF4956 domain-containing protein [Virgisporangium aliadipatigenens]GIJ45997.1 DUF4956 domain-containing protein [Virgisporangium aliadipatigenens]
MPQLLLFGSDLVAVTVLVFGLYVPRHRRRDLVVAYLGVNIGVLAVAGSLGAAGAGAGLGLGFALFGVLSIIRLRSTELDQQEVAYYFCALALGILGALDATPLWRPVAMMALLLAVMYVGDHPRLLRGHRRQVMVLDTAVTDDAALLAHLQRLLGTRVYSANVERVDLVNDTTVVDVRYAGPSRVVTLDRDKVLR